MSFKIPIGGSGGEGGTAALTDYTISKVVDIVSDRIQYLDGIASEYRLKLAQSLADLKGIQIDEVGDPPPLSTPTLPHPVYDIGELPTMNATPPVMPGDLPQPDFGTLLDNLDVGEMDALPEPPALLPINLPDAPGAISVSAPLRPDIDTAVDFPDSPAVALPEMEALLEIKLPDFDFPILPDFDGQPPTADHLVVPNVFINWAEPVYKSELYDELLAEVRRELAGGTGLHPYVEDAIFSRSRDRQHELTRAAVEEAFTQWASRNFTMPPGMLVKNVNVAQEQGRLKEAELNRDIMIEAAKWEIENLRFAVQQGIALEGLNMNLFENMAKRLFEVARFQAEAQINVFNAQVNLFNAQNAAFQTLAMVYKTKLEGVQAKVATYKTMVDAQSVLSQINVQRVEVFKARLQAVLSNVEVFKALMEGAKIRTEAIRTQLELYKTDVQVFAETIAAEKVRFDAYKAQVDAETSKAHMLDAQARAYASTVQGLSAKADIKVKAVQARIEAVKAHVQKYGADVEGYKAKVDGALKQATFTTELFRAQVDAYKAKTQAVVSTAEVDGKYAEMTTRTNIAYAEMQIKQYQAKIERAMKEAGIALEAAKAMGQYTSQLAAGAMSALHLTTSLSGQGSAGTQTSYGVQNQVSESHNHQYEM